MPKFTSAHESCDNEQVVGKTTATRMASTQRGATLTLWCADCEEFHGFEPKGSPFE